MLQRSESLVQTLLRNPVNFKEKNLAGQSPLHLCGDWTKGIEFLLNAGFQLNSTDNNYLTPLDYALSIPNATDAVRKLLKAGCSLTRLIHPCNSWGSTLDFALSHTFYDQPNQSQWPISPSMDYLIEEIKLRRESLNSAR